PEAIHAHVTLRVTDADHFDADARDLGVTGLNRVDVSGQQTFVGRVDLTVPKTVTNGGVYFFAVIDKRANKAAGYVFGRDGGVWDGFLDAQIPQRYPWLSALAPVQTDVNAYNEPMAVSADANAPGPVAFGGTVASRRGMLASDLVIVLIFAN